MPSATLWTFHRSWIYCTHPLHIWTCKLVTAIVANEFVKPLNINGSFLNVLFSIAK